MGIRQGARAWVHGQRAGAHGQGAGAHRRGVCTGAWAQGMGTGQRHIGVGSGRMGIGHGRMNLRHWIGMRTAGASARAPDPDAAPCNKQRTHTHVLPYRGRRKPWWSNTRHNNRVA
eukprot:184907-Chlamydomonas_euryale.AAC.7